jgi:alpha-mannosidase
MNHQIRFTANKIEQRIRLLTPLVYRHKHPISPFYYHELPSAHSTPPFDADSTDWQLIPHNTYWGKIQQNFVMRGAFTVPTSFIGDVALYLPMGDSGDFSHPEALIYVDGTPIGTVDRHHQEILIPEIYRDGAEHSLFLHGWTGYGNSQGTAGQLLMRPCEVVAIHQPLRDFIVLANTAVRLTKQLDDNNPQKHDLLTAVDKAMLALDTREPFSDALYASVTQALAVFRGGLKQAGAPLDVTVLGAGHAHIDVAWLWTLGQTRRKAARTFYNVNTLMSQFDNYRFTQSQPQLYEYIRQDYPELFDIIKQRVAEGKWEAIGGMWVEADCNLSGAESLARQFLLGRHFFREHFGHDADSPVLWLPDVFGYSAQLPQLIKLAGLEYFFTIKIGWNQYNKLPYDSFWWQGLDGTKVLTHFSTTPDKPTSQSSTYNAPADPESPLMTWQRFQQKEHQRTLLMVYGWGDGGGGPTREMLENITALANFPASPKTKFSTAKDFFVRLEAESGDKLPTWNGELYLEYHRGTYTTQARNKRANRKSEILLHDAEFLATYASILDKKYSYPHDIFRTAWRLVCLNQFHDIIPGSSIGDVYIESLEQYAEIESMVNEVIEGALVVIEQNMSGETIAINPAPFASQTPDLHTIAPYSLLGYSSHTPEIDVVATPHQIENSNLRVIFNHSGDVIRIYDKLRDREVLPKGAIGNQFQLFEDRPQYWDAWDIDVFYQDKQWLAVPATEMKVIEENGQPAIRIVRKIMNSTYTQTISLHHSLIKFDTQIDWREKHMLLKVAFPVDVLSPKATYDIQWGHVERPTHWNTSWDWAKFETVGHKWADLSEGDYGVSLINDCKYGYDIRDNIMRLTLLKSPTWPDEHADEGEHRFTYWLYPHNDSLIEDTIALGYMLNDPLRIIDSLVNDKPNFLKPLVQARGVIIETIKQAEDGDGVIIRCYEPYRSRGWAEFETAFPLKSVHVCNLLEDDLEEVAVDDETHFRVYMRPFQIITLRLRY